MPSSSLLPTTAAPVLSFRSRGDAPAAGAWDAVLRAMHFWPSPSGLRVERRIARVGRRLVEHVVASSDASGVLEGESGQLQDLLRPLRRQVALQPSPLPPSSPHAVAVLPELGRVPAEVRAELFAELVEELASLPPGAGLSVCVWRTAQVHDDDRASIRLASPFPGTELELRPVARPMLDAEARIWSPGPLPPVLLARAGAAFGHVPLPAGTTAARDADEATVVPGRLAEILATPGLTPPDRSRAARLGRPHDRPLAKTGALVGRVLTPSGQLRPLRLPWSARSRHLFICGRTGSGKSELIARLAADDMASGRTLVLVDPHGDLADRVLAHVPPSRRDAVVLIDPADQRTAAIPVLAPGAASKEAAAAFDHALTEGVDEGRAVMSGRLRRPAAFALDILEALPGVDATLLNLDRMLSDDTVRDGVAAALRHERLGRQMHEQGRPFWDWGTTRGALFGHSAGRHAFDHVPRWDLPASLAGGGIVIARLDQATLGTIDTARFGRILLALVHQATTGFARIAPEQRPQLSVIVDEAHLFTGSPLLGSMLAQLRKFGAALTVCSQSPSRLGRLLPEVLTNCATVLALQLPATEAAVFADRAGPDMPARIAALPKYHAALLLDDDDDPRPVVLHPERPLPDDGASRDATVEAARARFGRDPARASHGDLERFAELADALGPKRVAYGRREMEPDPARVDALVQATLENRPLPAAVSSVGTAPSEAG